MNNLMQIKKESQRLFKIAKKTLNQCGNPSIEIKNLSEARDLISKINGYKNWHDFHNYLSNKEHNLVEVIEPFNKFLNIDKFKEKREFYFLKNENIEIEEYSEKIKKLEYLDIGNYNNKKIMGFKNNYLNKNKRILCNSFPLAIIGSCGSGKSESMIQMTKEFINNNEGFIYFCCNGDSSNYTKFFSILEEKEKINDFYFLNFMANNENLTHTIDIINTTIEYEDIFKLITGNDLFDIIHPLCLSIKENNGLVTYENMQSFLSLEIIESLLKNSIFDKNIFIINNYLNQLNYFEDKENAIIRHSLNSIDFLKFLDIYDHFKFNFSTKPTIKIDKIILKQKVLLTTLPSIEKTSEDFKKIHSLIYKLIEKEMIKNPYNLFTNNYFEHFNYEDLNNINLLDKSKLIIGEQEFYFKQEKPISNNFKTVIIMKQECIDNNFVNEIKIQTISKLYSFPNVFYKDIRELRSGEGFVFSQQNEHDLEDYLKSNNGYLLTSLKFNYKSYYKFNNIYLNKTPL